MAEWPRVAVFDAEHPPAVAFIRSLGLAGVPVIAIDFGYADVPVATLGPDRIISSFAALPGAVADLASAKNMVDDQAFIGHKS